MKKTKAIDWLYNELPHLIRTGIISEDTAARLKGYYGPVNPPRKFNIALAIFSVIGAICIGLGIILLFAYNWDNFSRMQKTVLGFMPLILSAGLVGWGVLREIKGLGFREGVSVFNMLSVGAALGIISQVYHVYDDVATFIFFWMLLSVGVVFLLSSSVTAIFYMIGLTFWATFSQNQGGHAAWFWPLSAVIIPHYLQILKEDRYSVRALWMTWLLCLCFTVAIGICLEKAVPGLWIIIYSVYFSVLYFVGLSYFDEPDSFWAKPLKHFGMAGGAILAYLLTYEFAWKGIGFRYYRCYGKFHGAAAICDYVLAIVLTIVMVAFLIKFLQKKDFFVLSFGSGGMISILCYSFCSSLNAMILMTWFYNLYVLSLGVLLIATGVNQNRMGVVNTGMLLVALLIFTRFLDPDMSIILRGVIFILIGICFLGVNLILSKKFNQLANEN